MTDKTKTPAPPTFNAPDPVEFGRILMDVWQRSQPLIAGYMKSHAGDIANFQKKPLDPFNMAQTYMSFWQHMMDKPDKLIQMQTEFWQNWMTLWAETAKKANGEPSQPLYKNDKSDRRFKSPAWEENALFDYIRQSYLLTSDWLKRLVDEAEGLDPQTRAKLDFFTRQYVDAMSPSNFLMTNPDVIQATLDSGGENLVKGLQNLIEDLERGQGELKISTTDYNAFTLGENIATTPGKVVFENDLMQLIQYEAATETVFRRPLLIIPPWINKYYILDLRPQNSLIRWLVEQGHTVFIVSWVNPDKDLARKGFADYMRDGVLESLSQIAGFTGEKDCNVIGYCLGGTLLATTLAYLAAHGQSDKVTSATFLTTLVDFEEAGELKLFTDDGMLALLDQEMAEKGVLAAESLKRTFSLLRANDLIWSFVVNNYLLGREPFPFDLLYWNDDSTNMPAAMHSFYLRNCYRDNLLVKPGAIEMLETPVDIGTIRQPCYFLSTREDHIAPWKATYRTTQLVQGLVTFTLAASGHIAGVVNPPAAQKYCYWSSAETPPSPDDWLERAVQTDGSWWPHWAAWIKDYAGPEIKPRSIDKAIEAAPGRYVKIRAQD